jgi:hypothetical protein
MLGEDDRVSDVVNSKFFELARSAYQRLSGASVQMDWKQRHVFATDNAYSGKPEIGYETGVPEDVVIVHSETSGDKQSPGAVAGQVLTVLTMNNSVAYLDHYVYRGEDWEVSQPPQAMRAGLQFYGNILKLQRVTGALITEASIPPLCPTGDQFNNGTFEFGDLTGWTTVSGSPQVQNYQHHSGAYSCRSISGAVVIEQALIEMVRQECLIDGTTFSVWVRSNFYPSPPQGGVFTFRIIYDDASYTDVVKSITAPEADNWIEVDLKPYVTPGKTVFKLRITIDAGTSTTAYIDDVVCYL